MKICRKVPGAVLIVVLLLASCAPRNTIPGGDEQSGQSTVLLEQECEAQLSYLASVLETLRAKRPDSDPVLIELGETYRISTEYYLRGEYSLALSLVDSAMDLIETSRK